MYSGRMCSSVDLFETEMLQATFNASVLSVFKSCVYICVLNKSKNLGSLRSCLRMTLSIFSCLGLLSDVMK